MSTANGPCPYYINGECRFGKTCTRPHPPELSPELRPNDNYTVSDIPGQECQRCLDQSLPCDKVGRQSGKADPCSECRHFGGENANCVLLENFSRNDHLWRQMMGRGSDGYKLPAYKPRDAPRKRRGQQITPQPMKGEDLVSGWSGQTREELLDLGDMLPEDVRARPRAYLKAAGLSHQQEKGRQWMNNQRQIDESKASSKRKHDEISGAQPHSVPVYQVPQFPLPQPDPQRGPAESVTFNLDGNSIISAKVRYPGINGDGGIEITSFPAPAASTTLPRGTQGR